MGIYMIDYPPVEYHDWQRDTPGREPYKRSSPNLLALMRWLLAEHGGLPLGIYGPRPIKGGTAPSSHWFGAAFDYRYYSTAGLDVHQHGDIIAAELVELHRPLGIQMVIDYQHRQIWKSDRLAWKPYANMIGGGDTRFHIETNAARWGDSVPIADRLAPPPPETGETAVKIIRVDLTPTSWAAFATTDTVTGGYALRWIGDRAGDGDTVSAVIAAGLSPAVVTMPKRGLKLGKLHGAMPPGFSASDFLDHYPTA